MFGMLFSGHGVDNKQRRAKIGVIVS